MEMGPNTEPETTTARRNLCGLGPGTRALDTTLDTHSAKKESWPVGLSSKCKLLVFERHR